MDAIFLMGKWNGAYVALERVIRVGDRKVVALGQSGVGGLRLLGDGHDVVHGRRSRVGCSLVDFDPTQPDRKSVV